jgi:hypothetical protein
VSIGFATSAVRRSGRQVDHDILVGDGGGYREQPRQITAGDSFKTA